MENSNLESIMSLIIYGGEAKSNAFEAIQKAGYKVKFQLLPDVSIGYWDDFKSKFGF